MQKQSPLTTLLLLTLALAVGAWSGYVDQHNDEVWAALILTNYVAAPGHATSLHHLASFVVPRHGSFSWETFGGGWLSRGLRALRRVREAQPVSVGIRDVSARGSPVTARAVEVDLATLTPGRYLLQLELDAGPGNVVRVERTITVVIRD